MTLREMMAPPEPDTHSVLVKALSLFVSVVEDRQITLVVHQKLVRDPVHYLPNVSAGMDVAVRRIPEDWYKAPSLVHCSAWR